MTIINLRTLTLAAVAGLGISIAVPSAHAHTSESYRKSCRKAVTIPTPLGTQLFALCKDRKQKERPTYLIISDCDSDIANCNGRLKCGPC